MLLLPPLDSLRFFEVAARHQSFTRAGEELGVTPASVAHRIGMLEKHLEVPLLERRHRSVRLNRRGRAYLNGPCGPAWTGRPRPSTTLTGRGGPPDSGMARDGPEPVGVGVTGGDGPAGLAPRGAHRVGSTTRARGLGEGAGGPPGAGGDRAARGRPTATPTFGPGARRVPRRAPGQDEPPGGLVRLLNTWPHDRHDSRRRSSLRSAVIARDRGC